LLSFLGTPPPGAAWHAPIAQRSQALQATKVPAGVALQVAAADTLFAALDLAEAAEASDKPLAEVAVAYFAIGDLLGLARLRAQVTALPSDSYWQGMAKAALGDDLSGLQRALTADALKRGGLEPWQTAQSVALARARRLLSELTESKSADLAMLSVALRELRNLV
jgi:glutamate dehydrogenase